MSIITARGGKAFVLVGSMILTLFVGCSGNQNEDEFLRSAPPGKPSEFPNESVSQRKERTRSKTKAEHAADAKNKGGASAKTNGPKP
jgi:hypothetical protein